MENPTPHLPFERLARVVLVGYGDASTEGRNDLVERSGSTGVALATSFGRRGEPYRRELVSSSNGTENRSDMKTGRICSIDQGLPSGRFEHFTASRLSTDPFHRLHDPRAERVVIVKGGSPGPRRAAFALGELFGKELLTRFTSSP
jgi:hypothetical protein